jgi:predicted ester cyclase
MSIEENKAMINRLFEELVNHGNVDVVDELVTLDFVDHSAWPDQTPGPQGIKEAILGLRAAIPDLHATVEDIFAEGDKLATRETWSGTDTASGKELKGTVLHIFWLSNGKIKEEWSKGWEWLEG